MGLQSPVGLHSPHINKVSLALPPPASSLPYPVTCWCAVCHLTPPHLPTPQLPASCHRDCKAFPLTRTLDAKLLLLHPFSLYIFCSEFCSSGKSTLPLAVSSRKALDFPYNKQRTGSKHKSLPPSLIAVFLAPPAANRAF